MISISSAADGEGAVAHDLNYAARKAATGDTHLLNRSGPRRGGGAKPVAWNSAVQRSNVDFKAKSIYEWNPTAQATPTTQLQARHVTQGGR